MKNELLRRIGAAGAVALGGTFVATEAHPTMAQAQNRPAIVGYRGEMPARPLTLKNLTHEKGQPVNCGTEDLDVPSKNGGKELHYAVTGPADVSGDVTVNHVRTFDNNGNTGAASMLEDHRVYNVWVAWGADITVCFNKPKQLKADVAEKINGELDHGGNEQTGVHSVYLSKFENGVRTGVQRFTQPTNWRQITN